MWSEPHLRAVCCTRERTGGSGPKLDQLHVHSPPESTHRLNRWYWCITCASIFRYLHRACVP